MVKPKTGLIAVLDIGSTKVACVIARIRAAGVIEVKGVGHHNAQGFRAGVITDIKLAEQSILSVLDAAEQMAGTSIDRVIVSISGATIKSHHVNARMTISGHMVTEKDVARIISQSLGCYKQPVVHYVPLDYSIDGVGGIKDPSGMYGDVLLSRLHVITASSALLVNLSNCLADCQVDIDGFMVAAYASGIACLTPDELEQGCTVVDMGGGTTSLAIFKGGNVIHTDVIPLGGLHVTADIAQGLSTNMASAERVKTLHGHLISTVADYKEMIEVPYIGEEMIEGYSVPRALLVSIIRARIEETLEIVHQRLRDSGFESLAGKNIILTGGGSQLMGLKELASRMFNKQVRIGVPKTLEGINSVIYGNGFSTVIGMLQFAANRSKQTVIDMREDTGERKGIHRRLWGWFQENF